MFWIYALSSLKIAWSIWLVILCFSNPATGKITMITLITLIVVSDVIDGRIASLFGLNNAKRRLFDNFSDVIVTHVTYLAIIYFLSWSWLWYVPLFIRDSILVLMGLKTTINKIVIFPGVIHKLARLALPISAVLMICDYYGATALIIALTFFFIALLDYYGYFVILCNKIKNNNLDVANTESLDEVHLNSSFQGIHVLVSQQKLLTPSKNQSN